MKPVKARFTPDKEDPPRCSSCDIRIDDGSAVMEYLCRDCYAEEIYFDISHLVAETAQKTGVDLYDLLHVSGMFRATVAFREIAKGGRK